MSIVVIQMDAPSSLNTKNDTTYLMAEEARRRGHDVYCYTPDKLSLKNGRVLATVQPLHAENMVYSVGEPEVLDMHGADVVLMRQDPPFDMTYITATYLLEMLMPEVRVYNNPRSVRDLPEKIFPARFAEFMPPTLVSANVDDIRAFHREQGDIVIKPLYGYSGQDVSLVKREEANLDALLAPLLGERLLPVTAQRFVPEVTAGDRRVITIGNQVQRALSRVPAEGEIRSNTIVGGTVVAATLSPVQARRSQAIADALAERDILFAALDFAGDWLLEINVTSPGGFTYLKNIYGESPQVTYWDAIESDL